MQGCSQLTNVAIRAISHLGVKLRHINPAGNLRITDGGIMTLLTRCTGIRSICLAACPGLTDGSLASLHLLSKLENVDISECDQATDISVYALVGAAHLKSARLCACAKITLSPIIVLLNWSRRLELLALPKIAALRGETMKRFGFCEDDYLTIVTAVGPLRNFLSTTPKC